MGIVTNIVKRYIRKLIVHQAIAYKHNLDEIDMIVRIRDKEVIIITYSLKYRDVLNVLKNDEVERILRN